MFKPAFISITSSFPRTENGMLTVCGFSQTDNVHTQLAQSQHPFAKHLLSGSGCALFKVPAFWFFLTGSLDSCYLITPSRSQHSTKGRRKSDQSTHSVYVSVSPFFQFFFLSVTLKSLRIKTSSLRKRWNIINNTITQLLFTIP